jgi:hypothetical protein
MRADPPRRPVEDATSSPSVAQTGDNARTPPSGAPETEARGTAGDDRHIYTRIHSYQHHVMPDTSWGMHLHAGRTKGRR